MYETRMFTFLAFNAHQVVKYWDNTPHMLHLSLRTDNIKRGVHCLILQIFFSWHVQLFWILRANSEYFWNHILEYKEIQEKWVFGIPWKRMLYYTKDYCIHERKKLDAVLSLSFPFLKYFHHFGPSCKVMSTSIHKSPWPLVLVIFHFKNT